MILVGSALERKSRHRLRRVAELGSELRSLQLELPHRLDGGRALIEIPNLAHLPGGKTIHPELMLKGAAAMNPYLIRGGQIVRPVDVHVPLHPRRQIDKCRGNPHAAQLYERQVLHLILSDRRRDLGRLHLQRANAFRHRNGFGDATDLEPEVHPAAGIHRQHHALPLQQFKTALADRDRVGSGRKPRHCIQPLSIRHHLAAILRGVVAHQNGGLRHGLAGGVSYPAINLRALG